MNLSPEKSALMDIPWLTWLANNPTVLDQWQELISLQVFYCDPIRCQDSAGEEEAFGVWSKWNAEFRCPFYVEYFRFWWAAISSREISKKLRFDVLLRGKRLVSR